MRAQTKHAKSTILKSTFSIFMSVRFDREGKFIFLPQRRMGNKNPRNVAYGVHKLITQTIDTETRFLMYREDVTDQYIKRICVKCMPRHTN